MYMLLYFKRSKQYVIFVFITTLYLASMALQTPQGDFFIRNKFNGNVLQKELQTNAVILKPKAEHELEWSQVWYRDGNFLKCKLTNQALTMNPGMASTGAKLYVSPCQWSPYQKWITRNRSCIANHMEQCLVLQSDDDSNVRVKMERWNDDPKQAWLFVPVGNKE